MDENENENENYKDVYAYHGLAMYRAQCVEQSIIQLLIYLDFFEKHLPLFKSKKQWEQDFDKFDQFMSAQTLGTLVRKLVEIDGVDLSLEGLLREGTKERNHLAHHFFIDHAVNFLSEDGRKKMISELERKYILFNKIEDALNAIIYRINEKHGITEEKLNEVMQTLMKNHSAVSQTLSDRHCMKTG